MPTTNDASVTLTAPGTMVLERLLPGPIERVWAYLTDGDKRQKWIAAGDMDLKPGGKYEYIFDHDQISEEVEPVPEKYAEECYPGMVMNGHIIAVNPPRMLHMTWAEGSEEHSEVKFELEQVGEQVKLTLTHSKLFDKDLLLGVCAGWHAHVDIMADNLEGVPARPFWSNHMSLEENYKKSLFSES